MKRERCQVDKVASTVRWYESDMVDFSEAADGPG